MKKQKQNSPSTMKKAFTLIEILIVLAIITILAAMSLSTLSGSQKGQLFLNTFGEVQSIFSNARSMAISGMGQLDYTDADNDGKKETDFDYVTPASYGLYFKDNKTIVLFADLIPPTAGTISGQKLAYNEASSQFATEYAKGSDINLKTLALGDSYEFEFISVNKAGTETNLLNKTSPSPVNAIFYKPIYVDISSEGFSLDKDNPFLIIRFKEVALPNRCRQFKIHYLAGIPEVSNCPLVS